MYFLGYDLGSSAVKVGLLDGETGRTSARSTYPDEEMPISAPRPGWAEQDPEAWWDAVRAATARVVSQVPLEPGNLGGLGISYQMHGLVLVDGEGAVVRPSIIWCDSRAVEVGERAFRALGPERCLARLLSSPGNFTASKLAWVRENEPETFARAAKVLLPGDYLALRLTGEPSTTLSGLSEAMLWDFLEDDVARFVLEHFEIPGSMLPDRVPAFGDQGTLSREASELLGLPAGAPVTFRSGDQPANALALGVLEPGEIAATAGTSGVVYGVSDAARADPRSRVNSFAHVNHGIDGTRLGVLLCINGTGSAYRWLRQLLGRPAYAELNRGAASIPIGSEGLTFLPFGNGAERMLDNRSVGARLVGLDFNRHGEAHVARAFQEGIAFAFRHGIGILEEVGLRPRVLRAGLQNLFRSEVFRKSLAGSAGVAIELYDTDGAEGAARGAALGAGYYASAGEAFAGLERVGRVEPAGQRDAYDRRYARWARALEEATPH